MLKPRRVALLVDTSTGWSVEVIRGVARYVQDHQRWLMFVEPRGAHEQLRIPRQWQIEGIIARITSRALARDIRRRGVPAVNVSWSAVPGFEFPQIAPDETAVGRLAARHFLERGFRQFAYCGLPNQKNYADRCGPAFVAELAAHGYGCQVFRPRRRGGRLHLAVTSANLQRWVRTLSKPVGILAWDAERGRQVTDACWAAGIRVPDEAAVLGGEDDQMLCSISNPPLSAIDQCPAHIGYEAAALLDRLMADRKPPGRPVFIPPVRVVVRQSSDTVAIADPTIADAVRFIREHVSEGINVERVLAAIPISRRMLEQRFRQALSRSPAAEIRRVRIERAAELLLGTDWPIPRVAAAAGFTHVEIMNRTFRRELKRTPSEYRRQVKSLEDQTTTDPH